MSRNPFNFSRPARCEDFYNREKEIDLASGFLRELQSFSIIGEGRIGRTSFLTHILSRTTIEKQGMDSEKYFLIHFTKGSPHQITKDALVESLVKKIEEQIQYEIEAKDVFEKLLVYMDRLISDDKKIVIAFDDFEILEPVLDAHFSHWLRSIFQKQNVMAITAGQKTVKELEKRGAKTSPLYNIFANLKLGLFPRTETEKMIQDMFLKGGMELTEEEISFLADLSGGYPSLIQLVGHYYYREKKAKVEINHAKFKGRMLYYIKNQSVNKKGNILIRVSLSSLVSILILTVLSNQFSSFRRVPEIFLPGIGISTLIRSLTVLILTFFISYYIIGKIQVVQFFLDRSKFWIIPEKKFWVIPIFSIFILCYILNLIDLVDLVSSSLAGFISAVLTYMFLRTWFDAGRLNDDHR
jgi:hypothetical protein